MDVTNKIISIPTGEILNCHSRIIYDMYLYGFVKTIEHYKNVDLHMYAFRSVLRDDVYGYIEENMKEGLFIYNKREGYGVIIRNDNSNVTIKYYNGSFQGIKTSILITGQDFEFVDDDDIEEHIKKELQ